MKMKVIWKYKSKTSSEIYFESNWFSRNETLIVVDDLIKTGRVIDLKIQDEMGNEWTRKEFVKLNEELDTEPENVVVYFDGGFDIQSSVTGIGMIVYYEKNGEAYRIRKNERLLELDDNNEAEYAALYNALQILDEIEVKQIPCTIKGDSQVVIKQLEGEWPCMEEKLNRWLDRIEEKMKALGIKAHYEVVGRKQNKEADKLANQALEGTFVHSHTKI